jgi:hypothetical protein
MSVPSRGYRMVARVCPAYLIFIFVVLGVAWLCGHEAGDDSESELCSPADSRSIRNRIPLRLIRKSQVQLIIIT